MMTRRGATLSAAQVSKKQLTREPPRFVDRIVRQPGRGSAEACAASMLIASGRAGGMDSCAAAVPSCDRWEVTGRELAADLDAVVCAGKQPDACVRRQFSERPHARLDRRQWVAVAIQGQHRERKLPQVRRGGVVNPVDQLSPGIGVDAEVGSTHEGFKRRIVLIRNERVGSTMSAPAWAALRSSSNSLRATADSTPACTSACTSASKNPTAGQAFSSRNAGRVEAATRRATQPPSLWPKIPTR